MPQAPTSGLGEACALGSALVWAMAVMFFKRSGERISPVALNLFKNSVAIILLALTLIVTGDHLKLPGEWKNDLAILALSGIVGISIADTLFFRALNLCGVGIVSIVDCTYTPFIAVFSWFILGEQLAPVQYVGIALVLSGVLIATRHKPPPDRTRAQLLAGILLAVAAMASMGWAVVIAKPVVERWPVIPATSVRVLAGTLALIPFSLVLRERASIWRVFVPSRAWPAALTGSILGAYLSMILWIGGFKYAPATVAAVLNQTTTVFAILLATFVLREPFGGRKLSAVLLALSGVLTVTLHEPIAALVR